ncbi:hypothetical protein [Arthrobacter sp. JCM 19049]|uniref:hypothetical protein n=1 Tax=Arthrobacter sp. JCM 19049 TaxID=1460643 RepID=UPI000AE35ED3|nr:hypothetical protein [Arthrobacter sp. JCM 19049]
MGISKSVTVPVCSRALAGRHLLKNLIGQLIFMFNCLLDVRRELYCFSGHARTVPVRSRKQKAWKKLTQTPP